MKRSPSMAFLLVITSTACADMLGIKKLEFEPPDKETPQTVGSGGGLLENGGGIDPIKLPSDSGEEEVPSHAPYLDSLPSTWPNGTLFAVEPDSISPYYFAYEPALRRLSILRLVEGEDFIARKSWADDVTWTHLVALSGATGPTLIGYDQSSGLVERASNFQIDGSFSTARSSGNRHSHLLRVPLAKGTMLFGYDQSTGFYRGVPASSEDEVSTRQGYIEPGWTELAYMTYQGEVTLIVSDLATQKLELYHFAQEKDDPSQQSDVAVEMVKVYEAEIGGAGRLVTAPYGLENQFVGYWVGDGQTSLFGASPVAASVDAGFGGAAPILTWDEASTFYLRRDLNWIQLVELQQQAVFSFDGQVLDVNILDKLLHEQVIR